MIASNRRSAAAINSHSRSSRGRYWPARQEAANGGADHRSGGVQAAGAGAQAGADPERQPD
jgi:hypothetical protein